MKYTILTIAALIIAKVAAPHFSVIQRYTFLVVVLVVVLGLGGSGGYPPMALQVGCGNRLLGPQTELELMAEAAGCQSSAFTRPKPAKAGTLTWRSHWPAMGWSARVWGNRSTRRMIRAEQSSSRSARFQSMSITANSV